MPLWGGGEVEIPEGAARLEQVFARTSVRPQKAPPRGCVGVAGGGGRLVVVGGNVPTTTEKRNLMELIATCEECEREFDLADEDDASEWYYGHDCES